MKMMGTLRVRGRCRISPAVSKPSISAMLTSIRMLTRSVDAGSSGAASALGSSTALIGSARPSPPPLANQPRPQHRDELLGVDRLGQVVPGAGLDALLAITLHGLGGDRDDRDVLR